MRADEDDNCWGSWDRRRTVYDTYVTSPPWLATMRMMMRRLTRPTNAFSKKLRNLRAAIALHFTFYNFCRTHQSLRVTPAMAAGPTRSR